MGQQKKSRNYPILHHDSISPSSVLLSSPQLLHHTADGLSSNTTHTHQPPPNNCFFQLLQNTYIDVFSIPSTMFQNVHLGKMWSCMMQPVNSTLCILIILANPFQVGELISYLQGTYWFQLTCLRLVIHHSEQYGALLFGRITLSLQAGTVLDILFSDAFKDTWRSVPDRIIIIILFYFFNKLSFYLLESKV